MVVKYTTFVLLFSSSSVSGCFSLVDYSPYILMCRCPIVVFIDFQDSSWQAFLWGLDKSSGNLFLLTWGGLILLFWKCCMKILCQIWFVCLDHNVIFHNFWLLCFQGNFPHYSLLVSGAFYYLLSIVFDLGIITDLVWWCIYNHMRLKMILLRLF